MTKQNRALSFLRDGQRFVSNNKDKADLFNCFFQSVFTANNGTIEFPPETTAILADHLSELNLLSSEVAKVLNNIDLAKAPGPDHIPGRLLKEAAPEITPSLCRLFNLSLSLGEFQDQWKLAYVCPVFKKDDPTLAKNYRPISLLSILSKCFERRVFNHCYSHISPQLYHLGSTDFSEEGPLSLSFFKSITKSLMP